jgi:hypothetical protein
VPKPAVLAQPDTELREPWHNGEVQVSGSDTIVGTHRVLNSGHLRRSDGLYPVIAGNCRQYGCCHLLLPFRTARHTSACARLSQRAQMTAWGPCHGSWDLRQ